MFSKSRRVAVFLAAAAVLVFSASASAQEARKIRVGWQKGVFNLAIVKAQGDLERSFKSRGVDVEWVEFQVGPPMMEALNVGSLDIAATANTPPIFAQVAGADFVYVASESPTPGDQKILVRKSSTIKSAADLRGKKVAIPKGSMAHFVAIKFLESNGMQFSDIEPLYLSPADGRAALESGSADAWAAFDPLMAGAEAGGNVRSLVDGFEVKVNNRQMYFARREFAEKNPKLTADLLAEIEKSSRYVYVKTKEAAQKYASAVGLDPATFEIVLGRNKVEHIVSPIDAQIVAEQQALADTFFRLKIVPRRVDVSQAVWKPVR
mgnify:FL=1